MGLTFCLLIECKKKGGNKMKEKLNCFENGINLQRYLLRMMIIGNGKASEEFYFNSKGGESAVTNTIDIEKVFSDELSRAVENLDVVAQSIEEIKTDITICIEKYSDEESREAMSFFIEDQSNVLKRLSENKTFILDKVNFYNHNLYLMLITKIHSLEISVLKLIEEKQSLMMKKEWK